MSQAGGETSVTVAAVDNKPLSALTDAVRAPCNQAAVRAAQRVHNVETKTMVVTIALTSL